MCASPNHSVYLSVVIVVVVAWNGHCCITIINNYCKTISVDVRIYLNECLRPVLTIQSVPLFFFQVIYQANSLIPIFELVDVSLQISIFFQILFCSLKMLGIIQGTIAPSRKEKTSSRFGLE